MLVVFAATIAWATNPEVAVGLQEPLQGPPECSGESDTALITTLPLSATLANIPEFHDCQQFIVRDSTGRLVYDGLFAIFASYRLNKIVADLDTSKDTISLQHEDTSFLAKTVPVATIFSDRRAYAPLGIKPGYNCLLLYQLPIFGRWGAMMIPLKRTESNCFSARPGSAGTPLQVYASSVSGLEESDYPAVARWDWDSVHSEQYIGLKCGAAWCQVGRIGFDTSASYSGPRLPLTSASGAEAKRRVIRVTAVRGWYDEQLLAEYQDGVLRPSRIRGILVPDPDIDGARDDRYEQKRARVGFAVLIGGDYGKWNYRLPVNEILMCRGSAATCKIDPSQAPEAPSIMSLVSCAPSGSGMWAIVRPRQIGFFPGWGSKAFCNHITNHQHELTVLANTYHVLVSLPGTARWRWLPKDEGSWFGCISASCCTKT